MIVYCCLVGMFSLLSFPFVLVFKHFHVPHISPYYLRNWLSSPSHILWCADIKILSRLISPRWYSLVKPLVYAECVCICFWSWAHNLSFRHRYWYRICSCNIELVDISDLCQQHTHRRMKMVTRTLCSQRNKRVRCTRIMLRLEIAHNSLTDYLNKCSWRRDHSRLGRVFES